MTTMASGLHLFMDDHLARDLDKSRGVNLLGLYIGKVLGNSIELVFLPLSFVLGFWSRCESRSGFGESLLTFILLNLAITGLANLVAACFTVRYLQIFNRAGLVEMTLSL